MNRYIQSTPEGSRDLLYEDCRNRVRIDHRLENLFTDRGYYRAVTPELEYLEVFQTGENRFIQEEMIKVTDSTGHLLVLRPDMTLPIARLASSRLLSEPLPIRLSYSGLVFRARKGEARRSRELMQAGVELLGFGTRKEDLEILSLAVDALKSCGIEDFYFGVGHVGIVRALIQDLEMPEEDRQNLIRIMAEQNFASMDELLSPYEGQAACDALRKLPILFGGPEILEEAGTLLRYFPKALSALADLQNLYEDLKRSGLSDKIQIDLGIMNTIDYYTGMVFHGMIPGVGEAVLSGGRYDDLIESFGRKLPAAGFAMNTDAIASVIPEKKRTSAEMLIHFDVDSLSVAVEKMKQDPGKIELSPCESVEMSRALAKDRKIPKLLILSENRERMEDVL